MALNRLTIAQMVSLTKDWVQVGSPTHAGFMRVPSTNALMEHIEVVLVIVFAAERATLIKDKSELTHEATKTDARFDDLVRGIVGIFNAEIDLAKARGDYALAQELALICKFVLPLGLGTVSLSYREESGQTDLTLARIKQEHRDFLKSIPVIGGTLFDRVQDWIQSGQELGEIENQRADIVVPIETQSVTEARTLWIQMIGTVRSVVRMTKIQDSDILKALHRIERAEIAADIAANRKGGTAESDETPIDSDIIVTEPVTTTTESTEVSLEEALVESKDPPTNQK